MKIMVRLFLVLLLVMGLILPVEASTGTVFLNSEEIKQGELLAVKVETTQFVPQGSFRGTKLNFFPHSMGWIAFYGVSYWTAPGKYPLQLELGEKTLTHYIQVLDGNFGESHITVSHETESLIRPDEDDKETIARRARDREALQRAYAQSNFLPLWRDEFIEPTTGRRTTGFGLARYVNNVFNNRHSGIDIANVTGTPIKSVNRGIVTLAEELLVAGKIIIIDHGGGLFSSYCHLSKIEVEVGQIVERGQKIGEMGSTGFSTGPHLHWEIRTRDAPLDPDQFVDTDIFPLLKVKIY